MNTPKRYTLRLPEISYGTEESPDGEFVRYADYAALQAELQEARKISGDAMRVMLDCNDGILEKITALQAENERLRKAGDAMRERLCWCYYGDYQESKKVEDGWLAAKGVQS